MSAFVSLLVALVGIVIAWKLFKGVVKTIVIIGVLVIAAAFYFGMGL
ncbi:MAG: hypothetical protein WA979_12510 [Pacificimonas sp.]